MSRTAFDRSLGMAFSTVAANTDSAIDKQHNQNQGGNSLD